jgi:hypothetical protein
MHKIDNLLLKDLLCIASAILNFYNLTYYIFPVRKQSPEYIIRINHETVEFALKSFLNKQRKEHEAADLHIKLPAN